MPVDTGLSPRGNPRRTRAFDRRRHLTPIYFLLAALVCPRPAGAETPLLRDDAWEIFTDGRVGAFASWALGDGPPQPSYRLGPNNATTVQQVTGGGWNWPSEKQQINAPAFPQQVIFSQGKVNQLRIRNGYAGLAFGLGLRNQISPTTRVVGYFQLWAYTETIDQVGDRINSADVRQGFAELQGPWGSLRAGRTRPLFSRAAAEIQLDYGYRWSVGYAPPGISFPTPAEWFAAGIVYSTPPILPILPIPGLRLSLGVFNPIVPGIIGITRSKYASLQGELVFEHWFGSRSRILLFANALVQKVYRDGYCPPPSADSPSPCDGTLAGVGYGGRLEIGRVHLAVAGHRSAGVEPDYLPEVVDAEVDQLGNLRNLDGYSVRGEVVLGRFDVFGGASIARVFPTASDNQRMQVPADTTSQNEVFLYSLIKNQVGVDVGIVYNPNGGLYFDLDYARMQADWYLGERQVVHTLNCGVGLGW